jgi:hypothetical protein
MNVYNVDEPFERIVIDISGHFPRSHRGNLYLVIVMDYSKVAIILRHL